MTDHRRDSSLSLRNSSALRNSAGVSSDEEEEASDACASDSIPEQSRPRTSLALQLEQLVEEEVGSAQGLSSPLLVWADKSPRFFFFYSTYHHYYYYYFLFFSSQYLHQRCPGRRGFASRISRGRKTAPGGAHPRTSRQRCPLPACHIDGRGAPTLQRLTVPSSE